MGSAMLFGKADEEGAKLVLGGEKGIVVDLGHEDPEFRRDHQENE